MPLAGELFQEGEDLPQPGEADAIVQHQLANSLLVSGGGAPGGRALPGG